MTVHIIMACHNRRESTLSCIQSALDSATEASLEVSVTLYDDGSYDSTADAVSARFPGTRILAGTGAEYWAKSMAIAESAVLTSIQGCDNEDSYIVWLNDDVVLDPDAFRRLRELALEYPDHILVGAMRDPDSLEVTYSGLQRRGLHPLSFELHPISSMPQTVKVFNGNLVMVPVKAAEVVGGIDGGYSHAFADIDYGFRAGSKSIGVMLAAGSYGTCPRNRSLPPRGIRQDWKSFVGPKGAGNPNSMAKILRVATPRSWMLYFLASYGLWWVRRIRVTIDRITPFPSIKRRDK